LIHVLYKILIVFLCTDFPRVNFSIILTEKIPKENFQQANFDNSTKSGLIFKIQSVAESLILVLYKILVVFLNNDFLKVSFFNNSDS